MSRKLELWIPFAIAASVACETPGQRPAEVPHAAGLGGAARSAEEVPIPIPTYSTEATPGAAEGSDSVRIVERAVLSEMRARRGEALRGDGRLAILAAWATRQRAAGRMPSASEIDDVSRRVGHVGPTPAVLFLEGSHITQTAVEGMVAQATRDMPANLPVARYAIAELPLGQQTVWAIVLASLELQLKPVPRRLSHGETIHLSGDLAGRFEIARVAVTLPNGEVRSFSQRRRAFAIDVRLDHAGTYRIEIEGDGKAGPVVVANFPVYVDVDDQAPPVREDRANNVAADTTTKAIEDHLFALLNASRKADNLPPLVGDADLGAIARAHSQDMVDHGFFGHVSPETGTTEDRVRRAHVGRLGTYGENLVLGASAQDAHGQLMNSPGHRENMLRRAFTHVGIGAASQSLAGETREFTVTYLFAQRLR